MRHAFCRIAMVEVAGPAAAAGHRITGTHMCSQQHGHVLCIPATHQCTPRLAVYCPGGGCWAGSGRGQLHHRGSGLPPVHLHGASWPDEAPRAGHKAPLHGGSMYSLLCLALKFFGLGLSQSDNMMRSIWDLGSMPTPVNSCSALTCANMADCWQLDV